MNDALNIVVAIAAWTATILVLVTWIAARMKQIEHSQEQLRTRVQRLELKVFGFPKDAPPPQ